MKTRMSYTEALSISEELVSALSPACERIQIAGSIRRERPTIGDIEIVCIPETKPVLDLFGQPSGRSSLIEFNLETLIRANGWTLTKNGPAMKQIEIGPCSLDLYITTPEKWGVIFTLRTGSAEFSHKLVTPRRYGGYLPSYLAVRDGRVWHGTEALETPEERDFFSAIGMLWVPPAAREV